MSHESGEGRVGSLLRRFAELRRRRGLGRATRRALGHLWAALVTRLSLVGPRELTVSHPRASFRLRGPWTRTGGLGKDYPATGCHEYPVTSAYVEVLRALDEPVAFDVGAATGYYSLLACQHTDPANVHAFEVDDVSLSYLRLNDRRYADGQLDVVEGFVGTDGIRLDGYADRTDPPDVVKIDVDGPEADVLHSLSGLFEAGRYPFVFLEVHCWGAYEARLAAVRECFADAPYAALLCVDHRDPGSAFRPVDLAELPSGVSPDVRDYMVVLCPADGPVRPEDLVTDGDGGATT